MKKNKNCIWYILSDYIFKNIPKEEFCFSDQDVKKITTDPVFILPTNTSLIRYKILVSLNHQTAKRQSNLNRTKFQEAWCLDKERPVNGLFPSRPQESKEPAYTMMNFNSNTYSDTLEFQDLKERTASTPSLPQAFTKCLTKYAKGWRIGLETWRRSLKILRSPKMQGICPLEKGEKRNQFERLLTFSCQRLGYDSKEGRKTSSRYPRYWTAKGKEE